MGPFGVGKAGVGELGQRFAAAQPEGVIKHGGR